MAPMLLDAVEYCCREHLKADAAHVRVCRTLALVEAVDSVEISASREKELLMSFPAGCKVISCPPGFPGSTLPGGLEAPSRPSHGGRLEILEHHPVSILTVAVYLPPQALTRPLKDWSSVMPKAFSTVWQRKPAAGAKG